jgi:hypothetical protein
VPKKSKPVPDENRDAANGASSAQAKIDKKPSRRRSTGSKKSPLAKTKPAAKTQPIKSSKPVPAIGPSDEEIQIRAYFISERRHRLELPGDQSADWLEAKRQLLSETGRR